MDNERKSLEELAQQFKESLKYTSFPAMEAADLLDLMDYFTRMGMDFEAELCRYIAERDEPDNPEVMLTKAHCLADDGDWRASAVLRAKMGVTGYDAVLFRVEHAIRLGTAEEAYRKTIAAIPTISIADLPDFDFVYDAAMLFRDYGYTKQAIDLIEALPPSYVDYLQAQDLRVECHAIAGEYQKGKDILNGMLDSSPFDQTLWARLATCCYRNGNYDEALEACEYSLAIGQDEDCMRIKNYVRARQATEDDGTEILKAACEQQDYQFCLEYADHLYEQDKYEAAISAYSFANLFCPRGHRDREKILGRLAVCLIRFGAFSSALLHLKALAAYGGDHWDYYYDGAQLLFEAGHTEQALQVLRMAATYHEIGGPRYGQLAFLLYHYDCYDAASELWTSIFTHFSRMSPSFKRYVEAAASHFSPKDDDQED